MQNMINIDIMILKEEDTIEKFDKRKACFWYGQSWREGLDCYSQRS